MLTDHPAIILGTAMWGWTTTRETAFALLDEWYACGFREVDAATNYPIDKNPDHFRLSEKILTDWINANGIKDLRVMMKIGSVNNLRTPEHILTRSFILMMLDEYQWMFGTNLGTLMVHWDNRDDAASIRETLQALDTARQHGLQIGLSGIRHPEIYARLNQEFEFDFCIQMKHNILHSDYERYADFHGQRRFIAYGINAGGLKIDASAYTSGSSLAARGGNVTEMPPAIENLLKIKDEANRHADRPALTAFHQFGMINAWYQPDMKGILLGTSSVAQLKESIDFYKTLNATGYRDVYEAMTGKP